MADRAEGAGRRAPGNEMQAARWRQRRKLSRTVQTGEEGPYCPHVRRETEGATKEQGEQAVGRERAKFVGSCKLRDEEWKERRVESSLSSSASGTLTHGTALLAT